MQGSTCHHVEKFAYILICVRRTPVVISDQVRTRLGRNRIKALRDMLKYQHARDGSDALEQRLVGASLVPPLPPTRPPLNLRSLLPDVIRTMNSSFLKDGMVIGDTFCTEYRLTVAKKRILVMDNIITPAFEFSKAGVDGGADVAGAFKNLPDVLRNNVRTLINTQNLRTKVGLLCESNYSGPSFILPLCRLLPG